MTFQFNVIIKTESERLVIKGGGGLRESIQVTGKRVAYSAFRSYIYKGFFKLNIFARFYILSKLILKSFQALSSYKAETHCTAHSVLIILFNDSPTPIYVPINGDLSCNFHN